MHDIYKSALIHAGTLLDRYHLITLSGGNLTLRLDSGDILMTPSGLVYENLKPSDIVVMDMDGNIIEGHRRPSVDNQAIRYILRHRPDINAVIHTHQPYATALGLIQDEIPCVLTTLVNATKGPVKVAPYTSAASLEMGIETVKNLGNSLAVVLKHHGVIAVGKDLKEALYACIYLEEACKTLLLAMSTQKDIPALDDKAIQEAIDVFNNYGQQKGESP